MYFKHKKIGLLVSTYDSLPYIRLHLKNADKLYPKVPILVHDDGSPSEVARQLNYWCGEHDADFSTNNTRMGHQHGDLYSFYIGLLWAERNNIDLLVKMSRRWIPTIDWTEQLYALAGLTSYSHTYSSYCSELRFMMRTECIGLDVKHWLMVLDMIHERSMNREEFLIEPFMYTLARDHVREKGEKDIYEEWSFLGTSRFTKRDEVMWHPTHTTEEYYEYSKQFDLGYSAKDFEIKD